MSKLEMFKRGLSLVAGYGAGVITYSIINKHVDPDLPVHKKASAAIGAVMIGGIVTDAVRTYSDRTVDEVVASLTDTSQPK